MAKVTKKQALGRGLSALLKDPINDINLITDKNEDQEIGNIIDLNLKLIEMNPFQPRSRFNDESLRELASSIRELGVIQPITVRKLELNKYQLVSGERRFRASKLIGKDTIPAFIRIANDQESLEMALVENIQREDLDPIEIALSYQRLIDEIDLTQESMSKRVGKKRSTITNYLRLLKLHPQVQGALRRREISMGHGRAIMGLEEEEDQIELLVSVLEKSLSVRATEALVRKYLSTEKEIENGKDRLSKKVLNAIDDLEKGLGRNIELKSTKNGSGSIQISFTSTKDLISLKKQLLGE